MYKAIVIIFLLFVFQCANCQETTALEDSFSIAKRDATNRSAYRFRPVRFIIPAAVLGLGIWANGNDFMDKFNRDTRDEILFHIDRHTSFDDFSQYAPIAAMFALDLCKVSGKHSAADQALLLGAAELLQATTVTITKNIWGTRRPDGTTNNSFPSGHTATAFMGAHLFAREYWHKSPFIALAGYPVAAATGYFRMYNNRHWFNDVIAGAAIGILSVETAYCLYPWMKKHAHFRSRSKKHASFVAPYYSPQSHGLGLNAMVGL